MCVGAPWVMCRSFCAPFRACPRWTSWPTRCAAWGTAPQRPAPQQVFNLQYRKDVPTGVDLIDFSTQWPLAKRLYGVARVNYSMLDKRVSESLFGLEYILWR